MTHYEIVVRCSEAEYRKPVAVGPEINNRLNFLKSEAKRFATKVATKHQVKNPAELRVKIEQPEKSISQQTTIERSK